MSWVVCEPEGGTSNFFGFPEGALVRGGGECPTFCRSDATVFYFIMMMMTMNNN